MIYLTYKALNLHFFKQCETSNSHLYLNIKCKYIHLYAPLKQKLFHPHILVPLLTPLPRHEHFNKTRRLTTTMPVRLLIQGVYLLREPSSLISLIGHEDEHPHLVKCNHTSERDTLYSHKISRH